MSSVAGADDAIGFRTGGGYRSEGGGGLVTGGEGGRGRGGGREIVGGGGRRGGGATAMATNVNTKMSLPWVLPFLRQLYQEEGLRACFKGLNARLYRAGPGSGVLLVAYEGIVKMFSGE